MRSLNEPDVADVLLIEASDDDAELTQRALRKGGVRSEVIRVHSGGDALDYIFAARASDGRDAPPGRGSPEGRRLPGLIMLDAALPGLRGTTVVQRLKAAEETSAIPIVLLTTFTATIVVGEYRALGVHDYLIKPVEAAAFIELCTQLGVTLNLSGPQAT